MRLHRSAQLIELFGRRAGQRGPRGPHPRQGQSIWHCRCNVPSPVVACTGLPNDEVAWPEGLAKGARTDDVHSPWLEAYQNDTWHIASSSCFVEVDIDALKLQVRIVVVADYLPELGSKFIPHCPGRGPTHAGRTLQENDQKQRKQQKHGPSSALTGVRISALTVHLERQVKRIEDQTQPTNMLLLLLLLL